jgi:hypothetical protein
MARHCGALFTLLLAAACAPSIVATTPQKPIRIGAYSVTPQMEWSGRMGTTDEVWTVDGFDLQSLRFLETRHAQTLFGQEGPEAGAPVFRKTMLPHEIQEFVVETLAGGGWANIEPNGLSAAKFGDLPGFRFRIGMLSQGGLEYDGMVLGTVRDGTLHIIMYMGTRLHHYPNYAKDVEKLFASIRT